MNSVKRCLALFAATLLVGACSGDPTAGDAGAGLSTRTTPSVVWMREDQTLELDVEAVDVLGGTAPGNWTFTSTGPFTVTLDTDYQETSTGGIAQISRYILTPTAAGEGSVTFTGVGDPVTVPVRIAPDPVAFQAAFSDAAPTIGDTITITAPVGTRFTSSTKVNFYTGPLDLDIQQGAEPLITSIEGADSSVLRVVPPAGAEGEALITGISNVSTPTLTVSARTATTLALVDTRDLSGSYSTGGDIAPNTQVNITLTQPGYRFRDGAGGAADTTGGEFESPLTGGGVDGFVGRVIDSTHLTAYFPPGFQGLPLLTNLFHPAQPFYNLSLPMADSIHVDSLPTAGLGPDNGLTGPVGVINVPALALGESYVFWDNGTLTAPNTINLGGPQQWVEVVVTSAGEYTFTASWDNTADVDNYLLLGDISDFIGDCGACGTNPEAVATYDPLTAGQHIFWVSVLFSGSRPNRLRVVVTRTS